MPLDSTGFRPYTETEIRARFQQTYEAESGEAPDWDEDTFLGAFSEAVIAEVVLNSQGTAQVYDALKLDNATGRSLENLSEFLLIEREEATASRATVTLTGTAATVVPAGKRIQQTVTETIWVTLEDVTIGGGGTADVLVECLTDGPEPAPAGTLTRIVTPVSGWTSVTNAAVADIGSARETDAELRARRQRSLTKGTTGTVPGIAAEIEGLSFVNTALVVENDSLFDLTVGSFTLPGKSYLLLVDPSSLTAEEEQLLAAKLFEVSDTGIKQVGTQTASVTYRGNDYPQYWDYATSVSVPLTITLTLADGYVLADVQEEVETNITAYFGTLSIGDDVRLLGVFGAIDDVDGVVSATVLIDGVAADKAIAATQVATYNSAGSSYSEA